MELQAILVLCGLGVAGAAVLLLMGLFSASGTSYEEAVAQQRRAATELLALADSKNKPKKSLKKANKKLAKKEKKESAAITTSSDHESEAPAESGVEEDSAPAQRPHVEFSSAEVVDVSRDSPLNIKTVEKKEELDKKEVKPKQHKAKPLKQPTPEPVTEEVNPRQSGSSEAPKEQRKVAKKEKRSVEEQVEAPRADVVPPLNAPQPSELTTEKLLKQALPHTPPAKAKKNKKQDYNVLAMMAGDAGGVNVSELVRLVREAPLSRPEIQILTDALLNKHHDPLPVHSDWTEGPNDPMQKLKKQLADKEKALADEIEASQALHAKLKELRTSLNAERGRATALARAAEGAAGDLAAAQARAQRLADEHHALLQDKAVLQSKLNAEAEAQAQRVQMEMHIQRLSEAESALLAQLSALQAEASGRALEAGQARCEAAAARDAALLAQQHASDLAQQLQEANRVCAELDAQRKNALLAAQATKQEMQQTKDQLNGMAELQSEVQRLKIELQQSESNTKTVKEETEKQKQQLSKELSSLKEQLSLRESELAELKQMKSAHNGLPDAHAGQKSAELSQLQTVAEELRAELAAARDTAARHQADVADLRAQLQRHQDKNNSASLASAAALLSAARPELAPRGPPGADWLRAFADALRDDQRDGEQLQALVDKYKAIIHNTEGVLSQLQQNVTREEQRWAQQLHDKQRELDDLRNNTLTQMQNKIDSLQAELRQSKSVNHSNSFTDAERHTEERIMGGLSDKHKSDSLNGPLQVGIEEK